MNIEICIHRQLKAKEILNGDWKALYKSFEEEKYKHGIYFYHYGNSIIPFYIGKSVAASYNILGRVWQEVDDYVKGKYWLPKDVTELSNADCFRTKAFREDNFFNPPISIEDDSFKKQIGLFLDNVSISFSYIISVPENDNIELIHFLESYLQSKLIEKLGLKNGWIGDGGSNLTRVDPERYKDVIFDFKYENISIKLDETNFK